MKPELCGPGLYYRVNQSINHLFIRQLANRNALRIQTYTEPVSLKYGKLATGYPWGYTDIFYSVRMSGTVYIRHQGAVRRGEAMSRAVERSRVRGQVHRDERAQGPSRRRPRGPSHAPTASLPPSRSALRRLRDRQLNVPRSRNVRTYDVQCPITRTLARWPLPAGNPAGPVGSHPQPREGL